MTATIHGLTLVVPGDVTHTRRYDGRRPIWHCSATDSECQGHGRPAPTIPAPIQSRPGHRNLPDPTNIESGEPCRLGHTRTYKRLQPSDGRWHLRCRDCANRRKNETRKAA